MNVGTHRSHRTTNSTALRDATESAKAIIRGDQSILSLRNLDPKVVVGTILTAFVAFITLVAYRVGIPVRALLNQSVPTEFALTGFNAVAGLTAFMGTFIGSARLASLDTSTIVWRQLVVPIAVTVTGNIAAGFFFPSA